MGKQTLVMIALTLYGVIGSFVFMPFIGLAVYIEFAILRPQFIWRWDLPQPPIPWSFYVAVATIGATIVDTLLFGRRSTYNPRTDWQPATTTFSRGHVVFYLFGLWILLSVWTSIDPSMAAVSEELKAQKRQEIALANEEYLKMFLICTIAWWILRTAKQAWILTLIFAQAIGYIAFDVNVNYFRFHDLSIWHVGYGGLDNNGAGLLLALGIAPCVFAWEKYQGWYRWGFLAFVPIIMHAIMLTYSRGAMLSVIITSPFWILRGPSKRVKILLALAMAPGIAYLTGPQVLERFLSTANFKEDGSAQSRFGSWTAAIKMASDKPIFGFGTRTSPLFINSPDYATGTEVHGGAVHNQYLQVAADNGWVGMGFYVGAIVFGLLGYQKVIRATRGNPHPEARRLLMTAYALQTSLMTFSFGAFFLSLEAFEPQYYLIFVGLQLPLMLTMNQKSAGLPSVPPRQRPLIPQVGYHPNLPTLTRPS
jgi:O-antigen ligase